MDATLASTVAGSMHAAAADSSPPTRSSLTDAARRALNSKATTIIERWLAPLSPASVRAYRGASSGPSVPLPQEWRERVNGGHP